MGKWFLQLFGLNKNPKEIRDHLNEANVRSAIYMGFMIIILELWMIIRTLCTFNPEKIKTVINQEFNFFSLFTTGLAIFFFSLTDTKRKKYKWQITCTRVFSMICGAFSLGMIIYSIVENNYFSYAPVVRVPVILWHISGILIGTLCFAYTFMDKVPNYYKIIILALFSLACLCFGMYVSYYDFKSQTVFTNIVGDQVFSKQGKQILCFVTMVIFVGCLLIYKPYISLLMLGTIFLIFYFMLTSSGVPFPPGDLVNYITFYITLSMICMSIYYQRLKEAKKTIELEETVVTDSLTKIHNVKFIADYAHDVIFHRTNGLNNYIYLFINIENFKTYNNEYGFINGNTFLENFAIKLEEVFKDDNVARQSDDHFVVLTKKDNYQTKIEFLLDYINKLNISHYLSIKIGGYEPGDKGEDPYRAIDKARYAAYAIKNKYGEFFCLYDDNMNEAYKKKMHIINNIDNALENNYIKVYYQPVLWAKNHELCGVEALARWIDPEYGRIPPAEFVPVLEEVHQIHKLDKQIFELVCRDLSELIKQGKTVVPVSLNFSRLDFELMDAVQVLCDLIKKYNIPKELIHVEITESALTDNKDSLKENIDRIHKEGFDLWLDDFGSGYSSLNVLKDYTFEVIKIDMNFLQNFGENEKSQEIVQSIINLANRINSKTLTEGVETKEQADFLDKAGCTRLQGFLFGTAYPLEELEKYIEEGKFVISKKLK